MIIGLTGGIATGKSKVAGFLMKQGLPVVDADKVAREVVEPGEKAYSQIIDHFGTEVLEKDGSINRKELGRIIFSNQEKRELLNQIVHPAVRQRMIEKKEILQKQGHHHIVFDIPLLVESKLQHMVDLVVLVYTDPASQIKRLMERDNQGAEDAESRIASQMPIDEKKQHADEVIDNSGSEDETKEQILELSRKYRWII